MLKSEDKLKLELHGTWTSANMQSWMMLYAPLIGKDAAMLYQSLMTLATLPQTVKNHLLLSKISMLSMERMETQRVVLEQYLLIKSYYNANKHTYLYAIYMPKEGNEFLRHDVFGRLYMKQMGKQVYEFARKNFAGSQEDKEDYQEISMSMRSLMQDWDETKEQSFDELRPKHQEEMIYDFNFQVFLQDLSTMIFPQAQRTKENLHFIAEKAELYGISEKDMQKYVGKSVNVKTGILDRNKLIKFMQANKKDYDQIFDDPYQMPPIRFLQMKQHGVAVSSADQRLIDAVLSEKYHLQSEVINVLIEYVLERCNQVLSKSYVEKVAATWVRLNVDTAQKAKEVISLEGKEKKSYRAPVQKQLPSWYHDQDSVQKESEEIDAEALMQELRKLGES